jgi:hypothetical protein
MTPNPQPIPPDGPTRPNEDLPSPGPQTPPTAPAPDLNPTGPGTSPSPDLSEPAVYSPDLTPRRNPSPTD